MPALGMNGHLVQESTAVGTDNRYDRLCQFLLLPVSRLPISVPHLSTVTLFYSTRKQHESIWPPDHLVQGMMDHVCPVSTDMAVQNFVGDACRGATWVALHNGGGVGW